jgi:hypothetical protein
MHTYNLIINYGCAGQAIKRITELLPYFDAKPPPALIVKPIDSVNTGTLMVTSQDEEVLRIFYLVSEKQTYNF